MRAVPGWFVALVLVGEVAYMLLIHLCVTSTA